MNNRLYKAWDQPTEEDEAAELEEFASIWDVEITPPPTTEAEGAPDGWDAYCLEVWGEPHEFFIPSDRKIYRSRSSAQARVDLINRWGGNAVLLETTTDWTPVEVANRQRKIQRLEARRAKKLMDAAELIEQIEALNEGDAS